MTQLLIERYQTEWDALLANYSSTTFHDDEPANPLLLNVPSSYYEADCRIMIFGKETNGWEDKFPAPNKITQLLEIYSEFYNSGKCYSYGKFFWNGISRFRAALRDKLRRSDKTISILWNNVIKIGKANDRGTPSEIILKWEDKWFDVVLFEMKELKPDIVIFFCSYRYDGYIERIFNDAKFERINARDRNQLARVKSFWLPENSIRTYHPQYLFRCGFDQYLDEIVGAIKC